MPMKLGEWAGQEVELGAGDKEGRIYGMSADTKQVFKGNIKSLVSFRCVCMCLKCSRTQNSIPSNHSYYLTTAPKTVNDSTPNAS